MKKLRIGIIGFCMLAFFCMTFFHVNMSSDRKANASSSTGCDNTISTLFENDNYDYLTFDKKDINTAELVDTLVEYKNTENAEGYGSAEIETNDFCLDYGSEYTETLIKDLGFCFKETENQYLVYSKFQLKRLIVKGELNHNYGANLTNILSYKILSFETEHETEFAYNQLKQKENIEVYIDRIVTTAGYADQEYSYKSYKTWGAEAIDLEGYNQYLSTNGTSNDVVVAVLDTGVNTAHIEFENRFLYDNESIVGVSYYQSAYTYSGYSFEDDRGHGTHVSGTICDITPENIKILPIKIFNSAGKGSDTAILAGLSQVLNNYSKKYNIACVNMSLGGGYTYDSYLDYTEAFDLLRSIDILPVVAAGNEQANTSTGVPSSCENAIVVSASKKGTLENYVFDESYSNYGPHVDICAPGTDIKAAYIGASDAYNTISGTSMATPHVSAVVALLCADAKYYLGNTPSYKADEIESKLIELSVDLGSLGKDDYYGYGFLNLRNFEIEKKEVEMSFSISGDSVEPNSGYYEFSEETSLMVSLSDNSYDIYYTANGEFPNVVNGTKFDNEIVLSTTCRIYVIALKIQDGEVVSYSNMYTLALFYSGDEFESYFTIDSTGTITDYFGHFDTLVIPQVIDGIEVKSLAPSLFKSDMDLINVTLPDTCVTVAGYVFMDCFNLKYVYAPSVTKIYISAFYNCRSIEVVSSDIKDIVENNGVYLPKLTEVLPNIFSGCESLRYVKLDKLSVTGSSLFHGCVDMEECILPEITSITSAMFYNCVSLEEIEIGKNVSSIGDLAFAYTTLSNISVNSQNEYFYTDGRGIYDKGRLVAFSSSSVDPYEIKSSVYINGYYYLIKTICDYSCVLANLTELTIPANIVNIGKNCFADSSIMLLNYKATNAVSGNYYFVQNGEYYIAAPFGDALIQSLVIKKSVQNIPTRLFQYANLKSVVIESYSTTFGSAAFYLIDYTADDLYFEFDDEISSSYLQSFKNTYLHYYLTNIYAKSQISISGFYYIGVTSDYYFYSKNNNATLSVIEYETSNVVVDYDGEYHTIDITVKNTSIYTIFYGFSQDSCYILNIEDYDEFKNAVTNMQVFFKIKADGHVSVSGYAYLTINKISLGVALKDQTHVYGDKINLDDSKFEIVSGNLIEGDELILDIETEANHKSSVGKYTITCTTKPTNYDCLYTNATLFVNKRNVEIKLLDQENYYGSSNLSNTKFTITGSRGIVNSDNINLDIYTTHLGKLVVGEYVLTADYSNSNYDIKVTNAVYKILPKPVIVTVYNQSCVYGDFNFDTSSFSVPSDSIVEGDELGIEIYTLANNESVAGDYEIQLKYTNKNYAVSFNKATLKITGVPLKIKILNKTNVYGEINLDDIEYEIVSGKIYEGHELNISYTTNASSNSSVGTYYIFGKNVGATIYDCEIEQGILTIEPRELLIKIRDQEKEYGQVYILNQSAYEIQSGSVVNNDILPVMLSSTVENYSNVGDYIIYGSCKNSNYDCSFIPGNFRVNKQKMTIRLKQQRVSHDINLLINQDAYEIEKGQIVDSENFEVVIFATEEKEFYLWGNYELDAYCDNENYDITVITSEVDVTFSSFDSICIVAVVGVVSFVTLGIIRLKKKENFR